MSGHSKWAKIKRQKQAGDLKKGSLFTRLGQAITIAAREGGSGDPHMNFMLRIAIDKAKETNMPKDNIERAIKKGLGEGESGPLESVTYEVVGKAGVAILADCLTDNKNRTISDIRKVASQTGFVVGGGSLGWQFETKGMILLEPFEREEVIVKGREETNYKELDKEKLMLELMEINGIEDVEEKKEDGAFSIQVTTSKKDFKDIYEKLNSRRLKISKAEVVKYAKNKLEISDEGKNRVRALLKELLDTPDINSVWTNVGL